jgi:lipoyl(octanoyl) transferase
MIWRLLNTGFNSGKFNMGFDIELAQNAKSEEAVLRFYRWNPYCISLGANQEFESVNLQKAAEDKIDVVKRPTGGRAILHSEELTYSVIFPVSENISAKSVYHEINLALLEGLKIYDSKLNDVELESKQPDFPSFYKEEKSTICFAVPAKSELKYCGKKLVGSAQRKLGYTILQHGSILCGPYHLNIVNYLKSENPEALKSEIQDTTTDLGSILNENIDYDRMAKAIAKGFEIRFDMKFEESLTPEYETIH